MMQRNVTVLAWDLVIANLRYNQVMIGLESPGATPVGVTVRVSTESTEDGRPIFKCRWHSHRLGS